LIVIVTVFSRTAVGVYALVWAGETAGRVP